MTPRRILDWTFPLNRPHAGLLLGNGTQGLMIWGAGRRLCVTIGRAGFWDHRGGNEFTTRITFKRLRALLEAGDEAGVRAAFGTEEHDGWRKAAARPYQPGGGRLVITLPQGWTLQRGRLDLEGAEARIEVVRMAGSRVRRQPNGRRGRARSPRAAVTIRQAVVAEVAEVRLPPTLAGRCRIELVPAFEFVRENLTSIGVTPPRRWRRRDEWGFCQELPEDPSLTCVVQRQGCRLSIRTGVGAIDRASKYAAAAHRQWWRQFWQDVPRVRLPDPVLQEIVDYGLYKLACVTPAHGVACGLQGPFLEDYQVPPWSADYHFNINAEMIYQPLLAANRLEQLAPLWNMLRAWLPKLQANGRAFFEAEDALLLPHAVDDRCQVVGAFWTGTIDQACTAWMALLAWQQYRYGLDETFLRELAWPLLRGAFGGFWAMLDRDEAGRLFLPVSVSPEYRGAAMNAWGRNASFQLAAAHATVNALRQAAAVLGEPADPRWAEVTVQLPAYSTVTSASHREGPEPPNEHIALWQGQDLDASHRDHSFLAGIWPFGSIDPFAPADREIVQRSLRHWVVMGMGAWSGWCVPWAATLWARCQEPDAAVSQLHWWRENYVNEGRGTLHNSAFAGPTILDSPAYHRLAGEAVQNEIMQLDAGMGALTAVFELLVQCRPDGIHLLPALPRGWGDFEFDGVRTEGAFLVGATVKAGGLREVRVRSLCGGELCLHYPGGRLKRRMKRGEQWVVRPG